MFTFWQLVRTSDDASGKPVYVARPYITIHADMIEINKYGSAAPAVQAEDVS